MNEIVNKFLLTGDKCRPELHLKQPRFIYSGCGLFTKNKERIRKFKETEDLRYIYKNELDTACFQNNMAYGDFKNLAKRIVSHKFLRNKAFSIAKNPKYDGYRRGFASMVYEFFDKKSASLADKSATGSCVAMLQSEQLANELHKPIIRKLK